MPDIHPDFAVIVADPRNTVRPPPAHVPLSKLRAAADAAMIDPAPPEVAEARDAWAGGVPVRLYRPSTAARLPAIVLAHGGGFVWGSIATHEGICRRLALASGAAVISVGYRLAPEARFPAAMQDLCAVVTALPEHADSWGIAPHRPLLCGDSAGGHIALTAALALRDTPYAPGGLALIYPALDPACASESHRRLADGPLLTSAAMGWFWKACLGDTFPENARPIEQDLTGLPPALVITAGQDPLRDEGLLLIDKLAGHGVAVTGQDHATAVHGFLSVAPDGKISRLCLSRIAEFLHGLEE